MSLKIFLNRDQNIRLMDCIETFNYLFGYLGHAPDEVCVIYL